MTYVLILVMSYGCGPLGCSAEARIPHVTQVPGFTSLDLCEKAGVEEKRKVQGTTTFDVSWSCLQQQSDAPKVKRR